MSRPYRSTAAIVLTAVALGVSARSAWAAGGPGCDAGAACVDDDGDGFVSCACPTAGSPCDCDDRDPRAFPGAPEACTSKKDLNCNGAAEEKCFQRGCLASADLCVPGCVPLDDFGCAVGSQCEPQANGFRLCVGADCSTFGCPPGLTCDDSKTCVPNCNPGVRCPAGQRCRGFGCVDPCEGIVCTPGSSCDNGRCLAACDCFPDGAGCKPGETCDRAAAVPACVETACVGVRCPPGSHCAGGACVEDCLGVVCPPKRVCRQAGLDGGAARARCVDLCSPDPCPLPMVCDWRTGGCLPPVSRGGGLESGPADAGSGEGLVVGGAGCTLTTASVAGASSALAACGIVVVLAARRGSRRRRR